MTNKKGEQVKIINYGVIVTAWISADKNSNQSSIVIDYNQLDSYLAKPPYFGTLIGRFAKGKFQIGEEVHKQLKNMQQCT
ncbi:MAG: hypothetical protein PUP90_24395 [Nostoc sp. S4]|nr:hypothetical protein [Nostoc sp. S4]